MKNTKTENHAPRSGQQDWETEVQVLCVADTGEQKNHTILNKRRLEQGERKQGERKSDGNRASWLPSMVFTFQVIFGHNGNLPSKNGFLSCLRARSLIKNDDKQKVTNNELLLYIHEKVKSMSK